MPMKRLQISLEHELDDALAREARARGVSKAEVVRSLVREHVPPFGPLEEDPLWRMVGMAEGDAEPYDVDEVVYGGRGDA